MNLNPFIDLDEFQREVEMPIDQANLSLALSTQTARHAYYSAKMIQARTQRDKVARNVKLINAKLTKVIRERLTAAARDLAAQSGTKPERITVDMIQADVALSPDMMAWEDKLIQAEEIYGICKVASDTFFTRKEMLKSIGNVTIESMRKDMKFLTPENTASNYYQRRASRAQAEEEN
jgi:hypothetical protein